MAFEVTASHLVEAAPIGASEVGGRITSVTTSYIVEGETSDFGTDGMAPTRLLRYVVPGLPVPGSSFSSVETNGGFDTKFFVVDRQCSMMSPTMASVSCTYQEMAIKLNGASVITGAHGTAQKTITTTTDRSGESLATSYGSDDSGGAFQTQTPSVTVLDAPPTFAVDVVVDVPAVANPYTLSDHYVNKINKAEWMDMQPGQWLCMQASPRPLCPIVLSGAGGTTVRRFVYSFKFAATNHASGWQPLAEWIDPTTRFAPANLGQVGRFYVDWYEQTDFSIEPSTIAGSLKN